ncbi:lipoprotein [Pseudomonas asuensis]|uniref:Lipoprotein n=1 Tax=Pseudomonas asuensis TaxID=1825787 RepID=A0ABQ2GZD7_9PSED|nr:DUF2242 domain-containing protein [Pseudomonas asuensis]GGM19478.1 lipoprotein [Pseudomonas asuensis]
MSKSIDFGALAMAIMLTGLAGCSNNKPAVYEHENFDDSGTFSRSYPVSETAACEAARRALLSQGYIITSNDPKLVSGRKSFQQTGENHLEISFNVVCTANAPNDHGSTIFANALQDRYALKKLNNSASLGVGVLGSVSMPIGSTSDSMVKVASETVTSGKFYGRYFSLVENFLPAQAKKADKGSNQVKTAPASDPHTSTPATAHLKPSVSTLTPVPASMAPVHEMNPGNDPGFSSVPVPLPPEAPPITPIDTSAFEQFTAPAAIAPPSPATQPVISETPADAPAPQAQPDSSTAPSDELIELLEE